MLTAITSAHATLLSGSGDGRNKHMVSVVSTMSVLDDQDLERRRNHNRHNTTAALCSLDRTPAASSHDRGVPSVPAPLDGRVQMQAGKMAIVMATAMAVECAHARLPGSMSLTGTHSVREVFKA